MCGEPSQGFIVIPSTGRDAENRAISQSVPDDMHLSAVLENTALVQGIRCIPCTCAVFFHTTLK